MIERDADLQGIKTGRHLHYTLCKRSERALADRSSSPSKLLPTHRATHQLHEPTLSERCPPVKLSVKI